jgi:hypothetical protein
VRQSSHSYQVKGITSADTLCRPIKYPMRQCLFNRGVECIARQPLGAIVVGQFLVQIEVKVTVDRERMVAENGLGP